MELGCDGVLVNTAIAKAKNPFQMALAFKNSVIAGRKSYLSGRIEKIYLEILLLQKKVYLIFFYFFFIKFFFILFFFNIKIFISSNLITFFLSFVNHFNFFYNFFCFIFKFNNIVIKAKIIISNYIYFNFIFIFKKFKSSNIIFFNKI